VKQETYKFIFYKNIVADNFEKVFRYIEEVGKSRYLRELGKQAFSTLHRHINVIDPSIQSMSIGINESAIQANSVNMSHLNLNNSVMLNQSIFDAPSQFDILGKAERADRRKTEMAVDLNIL
jgi:predicted transcriptional regulator